MKLITAPEPLITKGFSIFLAGSIEQDRACQWQQYIIDRLAESNFCILNPRREKWNADWLQNRENPSFSQQVNWELSALEKANWILFYFDPNTQSPITLLELGLFAKSKKVVVCCPDGYWRKGNVDIICDNFQIPMVSDIDALIDFVLKFNTILTSVAS